MGARFQSADSMGQGTTFSSQGADPQLRGLVMCFLIEHLAMAGTRLENFAAGLPKWVAEGKEQALLTLWAHILTR